MLAGRLKMGTHRTPTHGYEATRETAMTAFAKVAAGMRKKRRTYQHAKMQDVRGVSASAA
jgi:hypothetical protein